MGGAGSVAAAKLRVSASVSGAGVGMSAYAVANTAWSESAITWNNKPARGAALASVTVSGASFVYYELDVTGYVQSEKAAGRNVLSLALHDPQSSSQAIYIVSREGAAKPQLVITPNAAPTVSLTAPANNAVFLPPANVPVTATASDADGTIAKVEFFDGPTLAATVTAAPYSTTLNALAAGTHVLTARATDNLGRATSSSAVTVRVDAPSTVSLTAPANNSVFTAPANITLVASAADPDGTVAKVDFYDGATLVGTASAAPYSLSLTNVLSGIHSYTARATDNDGAVSASAAVSVRVDAAPSVSITSPASGAVFSAPASITLTASAADPDGTVAKVDFYQGTTLIGTATASPYSVTVSDLASGLYSFSAVATDNDGAQTTSAAVSVTVDAPPAVAITSPANGASFNAPASIPIAVSATDPDGTVSRVEVYANGSLLTTLSAAPYSFVLTGVPAGSFSLTAKAIDNNDVETLSAAIAITVTASTAALYFIHTDHLNTPRRIYDASQQLVWSWDQQEPFGDSPADENPSGLGVFEFDLGFPGQRRDRETGLWYNGQRDGYNSAIGGYTQPEPLGLAGDINLYRYGRSNPLSLIDPDGLQAQGAAAICGPYMFACAAVITGAMYYSGIKGKSGGAANDACYDDDPCVPRQKILLKWYTNLLESMAANRHVAWMVALIREAQRYNKAAYTHNGVCPYAQVPYISVSPYLDVMQGGKPPDLSDIYLRGP